MMTLITMDASELKDVTSAADQPIAQSPVAWFLTRYGASSSQHLTPQHQNREKRSTDVPMDPTAMAHSGIRCYGDSHKPHDDRLQKGHHQATKWKTKQ